jgi:hypothetical protein
MVKSRNVSKSDIKYNNSKLSSPPFKKSPPSELLKSPKKKFLLKEILCAPCCLTSKASNRNNSILFTRLQMRVKEDLDISNLISKLNNVDLINYLMFGTPKPHFVKNFINPRYLREEQQIPDKLVQLRKEVIEGLTKDL